MPNLPEWLPGAVTLLQGLLNRFVPESLRPLSLWGIAILAGAYIVVTDTPTIKDLPLLVAAIFALASGAYTLTKPAEKLPTVTTVKVEKALPVVGKSLVGLVPAVATAALVGTPTVIWTVAGAVLARLFKKRS
jgi:predicted lysophospholipase L1 biosynthesis ABC-type transport system permease subunit